MTVEISSELAQKAVNTIKMLSVEMVQQANSGHPGMPMGCADIAFILWAKHLKHCPSHPDWINRDRFVLSAGHGSALLYSLLHLSGYDVSREQLNRFRQWDSITPGHPEYKVTPGVETTAGPLGQGFANGVGMAIAAKMMAARFNTGGRNLIDHRIYGICSDGDLMEGVSAEAASIAGHLGLDNIIYFYDDNRITIDGETDLAFTEDRGKRFEAYGWFVQKIDGHDHQQIEEAILAAQKKKGRPSLIVARTHIAHGSSLQDTSDSHGAPLGTEEIARIKKEIGWPEAPFYVPEEIQAIFDERKKVLEENYQTSIRDIEIAQSEDPELAKNWKAIVKKQLPDNLEAALLESATAEAEATRVSSGKALQAAAALLPGLCGGSADLAPSNKTFIKGDAVIQKEAFLGRNFHFGVREHGMGAICNGMALYGGWIPYAGTFMVFSDYMRPSIRLAALMGLQVIYVFTHDSIFVGEDGPTHQPVEHLAALRSIPGLVTLRPADATETAAAWAVALRRQGPTALSLSRQGLKTLDRTIYPPAENVAKGAYVLVDCDGAPDLLIIATGSEVQLAVEVQTGLASEGRKVRLVSMPSQELFEAQDQAYQESVIPPQVGNRVIIEAASPFGWDRYRTSQGIFIGVNDFGKSAPYKVLAEQFGFTKEKVLETIRRQF